MLNNGTIFAERYRIEEHIGQGGMADVYRAFDMVNKCKVAIKIIKDDATNKEELFNRFAYEINLGISIKNHFNIVRILNYGKFNESPYMVSEFLEGKTLDKILESRKFFDFKEACYMISQILDGLNELHLHGILHRDIKPQNIYVLSSGNVKIADFGISTNLSSYTKNQNDKHLIMGTPEYIAPEVVRNGDLSPQIDIYSLGIMFFQMITGKMPFVGEVKDVFDAQVNKPLPNISVLRPSTPEALANIIYKATEKSPDKRYKTVVEMKYDIENLLNNSSKSLKTQNWFERLLGLKGK